MRKESEKKMAIKIALAGNPNCGKTTSNQYEIHHVNKIRNLKGKEPWEIMMLSKRRKTMVVCWECHKKIHNQNFEVKQ